MDARALVATLAAERSSFVRLARRSLPTDADAEDVVQKAMMRATERAASLEDAARVRAWFGRIVRRGVVDFYRSRPPEPARDVSPSDAVTDEADARANLCMCSLNLLATLRSAYADVIRRIDMGGESPESLARELGITTPTLHVRLHRARHALRERVMKHCGVVTCGPCFDCTCDTHERCGSSR